MWRVILFLAQALLIFTPLDQPAGNAGAPEAQDKLKAKYPSGSLYLTYIPLNDMRNALNDRDKFQQLAKNPPPKEEILKVFRAFLNAKRERNMSDAVAFLQLDLNVSKAGYKRLSDSDGVLLPVSWSADEVVGIALFCDAFLNRVLIYQKAITAICGDTVSVSTAWTEVGKLKADPYISAEKTGLLLTEFSALVERRPQEMEALKEKDPNTHLAIQRFKTDHLVAIDARGTYHDYDQANIFIPLPDVQQTGHYSCGVASLLAILSYYGVGTDDYAELERFLRATEKNGTDYKRIIHYAKIVGLSAADKAEMTLGELEACLKEHKPVIVSIQAYEDNQKKKIPEIYYNENENGHFVVAIGFDDDNYYFMDPNLAGRRAYLPKAEFVKRWHDNEGKSSHPKIIEHLGLIIYKENGQSGYSHRAKMIE